MSNVVSRRQVIIEWGHCDPAGIAFNPRFFEYFDRSTWLMFETVLGIPAAQLNAAYGIIGFPLVDAGARFMQPAKFGDTVEIATTVTAFRRSSFDVRHEIWNGGALAAEGHETRVWTGPDPDDPDRLRGLPIPAEVIEKFKAG